MTKYIVEIGRKVIVDAEDADEALNQFWEKWEDSCGLQNTTMIIELNDTAVVREPTKEELEELGD